MDRLTVRLKPAETIVSAKKLIESPARQAGSIVDSRTREGETILRWKGYSNCGAVANLNGKRLALHGR